MSRLGIIPLQLRYQPQFNLLTNTIVGIEALTTGVGNPEIFFKKAEITGDIHEIGYSVIRQAAKQIRLWIDEGKYPVKTFINVSHHQLRDGFTNGVLEILTEYGLPQWRIGMEFTEYFDFNALSNEQEIEIARLKDFGFELAMDDFGMGATCLYNLALGVFDKMKVDKIFMTELSKHGASYKIVSMLASLAQQLNIEIVAEGIEHIDQLNALKEAGVFVAQGYLLCVPLPPGEINFEFSGNHIQKTPIFTS